MESLYTELKREGKSLENATTLRLPTRPTGLGTAYEDLGTTLRTGPPVKKKTNGGKSSQSQSSSQAQPAYRKFKPAVSRQTTPKPRYPPTRPTSRNTADIRSRSAGVSIEPKAQGKRPTVKKPVIPIGSEDDDNDSKPESEDEIDFLSSQPDNSDDPSGSQKPSKGPTNGRPSKSGMGSTSPQVRNMALKPRAGQIIADKSRKSKKDGMEVVINGRDHSHHPDVLREKSKTLAGLKFNKTKRTNTVEGAPMGSLPPSSKPHASVSNENGFEFHASKPYPAGSSQLQKEKAKFSDWTSKPGEEESMGDAIHVSPLSGKSANSNRGVSPPLPQPPSSSRPPALTPNAIPMYSVKIGPPTTRPRPRAIGKAKTQGDLSSSQSGRSSFGPASSQIRPSSSLANVLDMMPIDISSQSQDRRTSLRGRHRSRSSSRSRSRDGSSEIEVRPVPQAFPNLSPTSSPAPPPKPRIEAFPAMSPLGGSTVQATAERGKFKPRPSTSRLPSAFPMPSPQSKDRSEEYSVKTRVKAAKGKQKQQALFSEDENDWQPVVSEKQKGKKKEGREEREKEKEKDQTTLDRWRKKPKAFPMSSQVLASIGSPSAPSTSRSPSVGSSRPGKRNSEGGSGDERKTKKSRKETDALLRSPTRLPFEDEGDSISIAPHVDPRTLCPYCDAPLPSNPSPLLLGILTATKKKSTRDPRPANPLGLKASLAIFVAVCQRHRFESQILPEAERKGWPKTIDWKKLGRRIMKMRTALKALIEDPGDETLADVAESGADDDSWEVMFTRVKEKKGKRRGPKARSIFWTEVMDEVKKKGSRAVTGVRGQFANFEKMQPGYYGELGSVIIHQTLYNMFPPTLMDPALISPLTANEFVQRILVPEVALRLIMEDKTLEGDEGMQEALTILRDSSAYGVAMFPEDGGEWGGNKQRGEEDEDEDRLGVGDLIVMERARKRRKELEKEEEREEEERKAAEEEEENRLAEEKESEKVARKKRKGKGKEQSTASETDKPVPRSLPRPRPIVKSTSSMSLVAPRESDEEFRRPPRSRSKRRRRSRSIHSNRMDTDPASGIESAIELSASDSDHDRRATSEARRRSPSASETRRQASIKPASTRRSSRRIAGPSIYSSDSDASTKAVVDDEGRPRSKTRRHVSEPYVPDKMVVDEGNNDSDDMVEIVGILDAETPVQKRRGLSKQRAVDEDDDNTPRAALVPSSNLPPLLAARRRAEAQGSSSHFSVAEQKMGTSRKPSKSTYLDSDDDDEGMPGPPTRQDSYRWLLSSQSSTEGRQSRRNR